MFDQAEYIKLLVALAAIIDIPGNIPLFLQQTGHFSLIKKLLTAITAALTTCLILLLFAFFGEIILDSFGITIAAFKVLGGLVVLLIALDMLGLMGTGNTGNNAQVTEQNPIVVGIFPLAVPLFAGPGAITAVMVYAHESFHTSPEEHDLLVILVILSACLLLGLGLILASFLGGLIGPVMQVVMNRLLGMIVGALGVEFILEGLQAFFPVLANTAT